MEKNRPPSLPPEEAEEIGWGCLTLLIALGEAADWPGFSCLAISLASQQGTGAKPLPFLSLACPNWQKLATLLQGLRVWII